MNRVVVVGNLVRDVSVKQVNGTSVANVTVADNWRSNKDAPEETTYFDVTLWGSLADNLARAARQGTRVFVEGRMREEKWTGRDGNERKKLAIVADNAGLELRFAGTAPAESRSSSSYSFDE